MVFHYSLDNLSNYYIYAGFVYSASPLRHNLLSPSLRTEIHLLLKWIIIIHHYEDDVLTFQNATKFYLEVTLLGLKQIV